MQSGIGNGSALHKILKGIKSWIGYLRGGLENSPQDCSSEMIACRKRTRIWDRVQCILQKDF